MHRAKAIRLMTEIRDAGGTLPRADIPHSTRMARSGCLSSPWPIGLSGLVLEEKVRGRRVLRQWTLTPDGMQLLNDLLTDPNAQPPVHRGRPATTESVDAQEYRKARNRKYLRDQRRKAKRARPSYHPVAPEQYKTPLRGVDPKDWKQFAKLTNLERIRILRTRIDRNKEN